MSFERLLAHRVDIDRPANRPQKDRFGQMRFEEGWEPRYANISCRYDPPSGNRQHTSEVNSVLRPSVLVIVPAHASEVSEADRVTEVRDADGLVVGRNLTVQHVKRINGMDGRAHHFELTCMEVYDPS